MTSFGLLSHRFTASPDVQMLIAHASVTRKGLRILDAHVSWLFGSDCLRKSFVCEVDAMFELLLLWTVAAIRTERMEEDAEFLYQQLALNETGRVKRS